MKSRAEWLGGVRFVRAPARHDRPARAPCRRYLERGREMLCARLLGACSRYMLRAMVKWPLIGRHVRAARAGQSGTSRWAYLVCNSISTYYGGITTSIGVVYYEL